MLAQCALCQEEKLLRKSHVISKRIYKEISRDDKRRMVTVDPATGEQIGLRQDGPKEHLLCEDCEQFFNREYEQPFYTYWLDGNPLAGLEHQELVTLTDIDYRRFKLFHLSILFRAGASTLPEYWEVQLGPHLEKIRLMLRSSATDSHWMALRLLGSLSDPYTGWKWMELDFITSLLVDANGSISLPVTK